MRYLKHSRISTLLEMSTPSYLWQPCWYCLCILALESAYIGVNTITIARWYMHLVVVHNDAKFKRWPNWLVVGKVYPVVPPCLWQPCCYHPSIVALESPYIGVNTMAMIRQYTYSLAHEAPTYSYSFSYLQLHVQLLSVTSSVIFGYRLLLFQLWWVIVSYLSNYCQLLVQLSSITSSVIFSYCQLLSVIVNYCQLFFFNYFSYHWL
jgi:hypothetical protein